MRNDAERRQRTNREHALIQSTGSNTTWGIRHHVPHFDRDSRRVDLTQRLTVRIVTTETRTEIISLGA